MSLVLHETFCPRACSNSSTLKAFSFTSPNFSTSQASHAAITSDEGRCQHVRCGDNLDLHCASRISATMSGDSTEE